MGLFSVKAFKQELEVDKVWKFNRTVEQIDNHLKQEMASQGWELLKIAQRTVIYSFGEVTFSRRCYRKGEQYRYPADEELGLDRYQRYSSELLMRLAKDATNASYRAVAQMWQAHGVWVTKDTVSKAVRYVGKLYEEREEYRYYKEEIPAKKQKCDELYIEGDGIMINTRETSGEVKKTELSHFVVHAGIDGNGKKRRTLKQKYAVVGVNKSQTKHAFLDYLYNHVNISPNSLITTNSDMGKGFTPYIFKEICAPFRCRHEHFWDYYHLNKEIQIRLRPFPKELRRRLFDDLKKHRKTGVKLILDTCLSMIQEEENYKVFEMFSNKLLNNFKYTESPKSRGLSEQTIGIMESQQCKISNRMKRRKMCWSVKGAETMARMIVDISQGVFDELFEGAWRDEFRKMKEVTQSAAAYVKNNGHVDDTKGGKLTFSYRMRD